MQELTIIDGNDLTRAFVAWGDRGATDGQIGDANDAVPNLTGPTGWVLDGLTIQNCVSDANNRQDILSAARDLLTNYTGTPYTLVTAGEENGAIADNPDAFEVLSGSADDDLTDVELQTYLDENPPGSAGHLVINGEMNEKGGAICMLNGAKGTIRNCTFLNNSAVNDGGAIYANLSPFNAVGDAGISLEGVTIDGCTAGDDGGGLCVDSSGDDPNSVPALVINSTMVTNCRAGGPAPDDGDRDGGGIYLNNRLNVTITSTLVDTCTAGRHGAGIMMDGQVVAELDGCQISNCANDVIDGEGGDGAAISIDTDASIVSISNCIFNNNVNSQDDGIVRVDAHEAMIINCTFVGNVSAADQGIVRYSTDEDDTSVHNGVVNCMFVNNDPSGGSDQVIAHNKGNVTYTYTNNAFFGNILDEGDSHIDSIADEDLGLFGNLLLTTDPLIDTAGGDYHLAVGSEAINAGTADGAPDHDIEGNARPQGAAPDIGAYESPAN